MSDFGNQRKSTVASAAAVPWWGVGLFLAAGTLLIFLSREMVRRSREASTWPVTEATIVRSDLGERDEWESGFDEGSPDELVTYYAPLIEYTYEVYGSSYRSDRITPAPTSWSSVKSSALSTLEEYALGLKTVAYYNPDQPEVAYLSSEVGWDPWFYGLMGTVFLGVGICAIVVNRRLR